MDNSILERYKLIIQMLKGQFGDSCQAILYSVNSNKTGNAISFCGTTTNINIGEPIPSYLKEFINDPAERYGFINKNISGLVLRTSIHCIYGQTGELVGLFCIHHNLMHMQMISSFLDELLKPENPEDDNENIEPRHVGSKKYEASDIQSFLDQIITDFLKGRIGFNDFSKMGKTDKLDLIAELDRKGVFLVKGAVNQIAKRINISKFTIYNYLDELRVLKEESSIS